MEEGLLFIFNRVMLRIPNITPWMTSSCHLCECVSVFISVLAKWPAQWCPSSKCMLNWPWIGAKKETRSNEWINTTEQQRRLQSEAIKDILDEKCIHASTPIQKNYKRKINLMFVCIAAATRHLIQSSHLSEKCSAAADTTDNYYSGVLTSQRASHMDCICT